MCFLDISLYCLIELIDQFWRISSLVEPPWCFSSPSYRKCFNEKRLSTRPKPPSCFHSFFTIASFIMALRYANWKLGYYLNTFLPFHWFLVDIHFSLVYLGKGSLISAACKKFTIRMCNWERFSNFPVEFLVILDISFLHKNW